MQLSETEFIENVNEVFTKANKLVVPLDFLSHLMKNVVSIFQPGKNFFFFENTVLNAVIWAECYWSQVTFNKYLQYELERWRIEPHIRGLNSTSFKQLVYWFSLNFLLFDDNVIYLIHCPKCSYLGRVLLATSNIQ